MPLDGPSEFLRPAKPGDLTPFLRKLLRGGTLASDESRMAFEEIASGESHHAEMGALLALLATRIPTVDEIVGAAAVMRARVEHDLYYIDNWSMTLDLRILWLTVFSKKAYQNAL